MSFRAAGAAPLRDASLITVRWDYHWDSSNNGVQPTRQQTHAAVGRAVRPREGWNLERLRAETQQSRYRDLALGLFSGIAQFSYVSLTELTEHFGSELATAFWSVFSIARGEIGALTYPTELNLAEQRSLYRVDNNRAMGPLANQLFLAVLTRYENHLASGTARESFFRRRDKILEQEAV